MQVSSYTSKKLRLTTDVSQYILNSLRGWFINRLKGGKGGLGGKGENFIEKMCVCVCHTVENSKFSQENE